MAKVTSKINPLSLLYPLKLLLCIVGAILIFVVGLLSLVGWLPLRVLVQCLAKVVRRDLDGMLRPSRVALALDDIYNKPEFNILGCIEYEGTVSKKLFCDVFRERVLGPNFDRVPIQYKRLATPITSFCGYYFWKKSVGFNFENHIRTFEEVLEDDQGIGSDGFPVRQVYTDDDLKDIASRLTTLKWRPGQSPWEIIIVQNYRSSHSTKNAKDSEGEGPLGSVILYRFHHCLADGYSLMNFIGDIHNCNDHVTTRARFRKSHPCFQLYSALAMPLLVFWDTVLWLYHRQWDWNAWVRKSRATSLWSQYYSTWNCEVPLDRIKNLKNRFNVSFYSVQLAIIGGVLARTMRATGAKVPGKLTCMIPVPLPNHPLGLHIHMGAALVNIYTGEKDFVKRLKRTHKAFVRDWTSLGQKTFTNLALFVCLGPNFFSRNLLLSPRMTFVFSPFPGFTRMELTPEHRCTSSIFTVGMPPKKISVCNMTSFSCFGKINFTFTCRRNIINSRPTLDQFAQFLEEEIAALENSPVIEDV